MTVKPFYVVKPVGVAWAMRFRTEDAAWSRVLALVNKGLRAPKTQTQLRAIGWRVLQREVTSATDGL